jgi:hypothetical protein
VPFVIEHIDLSIYLKYRLSTTACCSELAIVIAIVVAVAAVTAIAIIIIAS